MTTRSLACIIGWPIAHSLSPVIHNAAFAAAGLDWTYMSIGIRPGAIREGVDLLDTLGVAGANVTAPHKQAVLPLLAAIDDEAAAIGAVNTITRRAAGFEGSNTDGRGFIRFLTEDAGLQPDGLRAGIVGGGGAARAIAFALATAGAAVAIGTRDDAQAADIADMHPSIEQVPWPGTGPVDLLVQATSAVEGLPLTAMPFGEQVVAVDLVYGRRTGFLEAASAAGARAFDGIGMLVHQAALSFETWTGVGAPIDVMRRAAEEAIRPT